MLSDKQADGRGKCIKRGMMSKAANPEVKKAVEQGINAKRDQARSSLVVYALLAMLLLGAFFIYSRRRRFFA